MIHNFNPHLLVGLYITIRFWSLESRQTIFIVDLYCHFWNFEITDCNLTVNY